MVCGEICRGGVSVFQGWKWLQRTVEERVGPGSQEGAAGLETRVQ